MIEFIKAYRASDGTVCPDLEAVKAREILLILASEAQVKPSDAEITMAASLVTVLLRRSESVVDILTTKESSIPAARSLHGGKKTRKSKHLAAQTTIPGTGLPPEILDEKREEAK